MVPTGVGAWFTASEAWRSVSCWWLTVLLPSPLASLRRCLSAQTDLAGLVAAHGLHRSTSGRQSVSEDQGSAPMGATVFVNLRVPLRPLWSFLSPQGGPGRVRWTLPASAEEQLLRHGLVLTFPARFPAPELPAASEQAGLLDLGGSGLGLGEARGRGGGSVVQILLLGGYWLVRSASTPASRSQRAICSSCAWKS